MNTTSFPDKQHANHCGSGCQPTAHDEIAQAAFHIYQKHGSQDGHDVRNWLDAEVHVAARHAAGKHGQHAAGNREQHAAAKTAGPSAR